MAWRNYALDEAPELVCDRHESCEPTVDRRNDLILFDARGSVQLSDDPNDTAGPGGANTGRKAPNALLPQHGAGALIGQIGNSNAFLIGNRRSLRAPASGRLYLGVNDDHLEDNGGDFQIMITITDN